MTIPEEIQVQVPTYPQYTNLALGEGLFDQLMKSVEHHLDLQYTKNRIKGSEYAEVYVGSIQAVMQYTTQYLLGTMLINEQKAQAEATIALTEVQEKQVEAQTELIELEKLKLQYQIEQILPLEKEKLAAEVIRITQEGLLIEAQIRKIDAEILNLIQQEILMVKQGEKIDAEISMLAAQESMLLKQALKIDQEILFMQAKIITERVNVEAGLAAGDSLLGRQISLLGAQKLGFAGDLQVKAAKVYADYDAVFQGVQETPEDATLHSGATDMLGKASTTSDNIAGQ